MNICPICLKSFENLDVLSKHILSDDRHKNIIVNQLALKNMDDIIKMYFSGFLNSIPDDWVKYPSIDALSLYTRQAQTVRNGCKVRIEIKRDGSCVSIVKGLKVFTHNQRADDNVANQVIQSIENCKDAIFELVNNGYIVYGELLQKGKSPARFEVHDKTEFLVFDILNTNTGKFWSFGERDKYCIEHNIPYIASSVLRYINSIEELDNLNKFLIDEAHENNIEGYVIKWQDDTGTFMAKSKQEYKYGKPQTKSNKPYNTGKPIEPALEMSEILGAINKVKINLGDAFYDTSKAMPDIAKSVKEEEKKHGKKCYENIFTLYQKIKDGLL